MFIVEQEKIIPQSAFPCYEHAQVDGQLNRHMHGMVQFRRVSDAESVIDGLKVHGNLFIQQLTLFRCCKIMASDS